MVVRNRKKERKPSHGVRIWNTEHCNKFICQQRKTFSFFKTKKISNLKEAKNIWRYFGILLNPLGPYVNAFNNFFARLSSVHVSVRQWSQFPFFLYSFIYAPRVQGNSSARIQDQTSNAKEFSEVATEVERSREEKKNGLRKEKVSTG